MIKIRAFRATDALPMCLRYVEGHTKVLEIFEIAHITSANTDWIHSPLVFPIIAMSPSGDTIYGGAKIHIAGGSLPLPLEDAVGDLDPKVYDMVDEQTEGGVGELCGLWINRSAAGEGYAELLTKAAVARASVVIADQLKLSNMFILCGEHTVNLAKKFGFKEEEQLGNKGKFPYPKENLRATVLSIVDLETLNTADPVERETIFSLRKNPNQIRREVSKNGTRVISYDLMIPTLEAVYS